MFLETHMYVMYTLKQKKTMNIKSFILTNFNDLHVSTNLI